MSMPYAFILIAALAACVEPGGGDPAVVIDEASLLSTIQAYRRSPAFVRVNDLPYASALSATSPIDVYVSQHAFAAYASITPDVSGSRVIVPEGTVIVREVRDEAGVVARLTVMARLAAGYNPELGDYWFAVTSPTGEPVVDNGVAKTGRLTECFGCHLERVEDDYLFGVLADQRPDDGGPAPTPPDEEPPPPGGGGGPVCGDYLCQAGESHDSCESDCDDDDDDAAEPDDHDAEPDDD
jgi:hypothetical protein